MEQGARARRPEPPRASWRDAVSMRPQSALLIAAVVAGSWLRFYRLGALQLSADEGASWVAADAPSVREVIAIQATHNAGKLPLHDLLLHGWMALFGHGLYAMRSLSALFGVLAVVLVAPATRELIRAYDDRWAGDDSLEFAGGVASLFCAVSIVFIKYDTQVRMYSVLLAACIAQVWFFLRTLRTRAMLDAAILALMTDAALAANLVSTALVATEGIWLLALLARRQTRAALTAGFAMLAGVAALSPALYHLAMVDIPMVRRGIVRWLLRPPWWEPAAFFNKALGTFGFPVFAALAVWGCVRCWPRIKPGIQFGLLWMWAPPIVLVLGSYLWRPMFVERYALYSFPPFFILAALGACAMRDARNRRLAIAIAVGFALGHTYSYWRKPHDTDWRGAAHIAAAALAPGDTIAVAPDYAVEVVRYYMVPSMRPCAVRYGTEKSARVVIVSNQFRDPAMRGEMKRAHPRLLARFRGVIVISR